MISSNKPQLSKAQGHKPPLWMVKDHKPSKIEQSHKPPLAQEHGRLALSEAPIYYKSKKKKKMIWEISFTTLTLQQSNAQKKPP